MDVSSGRIENDSTRTHPQKSEGASQFSNHLVIRGILEDRTKPDNSKCVDVVTCAALWETIVPSMMAVGNIGKFNFVCLN